MTDAFICDGLRTPIGRYGGALSGVRTDDLAAITIAALMAKHRDIDWASLDDVIYGCANQAGEDNRNVARMAALLAGLPVEVPGATINRLCGSGLDAVGTAARAIRAGEAGLIIAGCNVENATYGLTICAERVAVVKAISDGEREFVRIAIVADTDAPTPPCGAACSHWQPRPGEWGE